MMGKWPLAFWVWFGSGLGLFLGGVWVWFWCWSVFLGVFCLFGWVRLCPFSPSSSSVSFLAMMIWASCPHGVRTRGKKSTSRSCFCQFFEIDGVACTPRRHALQYRAM